MNYLNKILMSKLPRFSDLLQEAQRAKENNVTVHRNSKKDIDRRVVRPWKPMPNIRNFELRLSSWDWLFSIFGMFKRFPPKLELWEWRNGPANKYIDYMFKRLSKQVQLRKYDEARKTIWILMKSTAYQVACYNYVNKNWHRKYEWWKVMKDLKGIRHLVNWRIADIDYKRVYIPKGKDQLRPLGVPTMTWRVYLHMYNNCITQWRMITEKGNQHGYLPSRGVITAWQELVELVKMPNIYEADFKNFFGSVNIKGIGQILKHIGFPTPEIAFISELNVSYPRLNQKEDIIDEFKIRQYQYIKNCVAFQQTPEGPLWEPLKQMLVKVFGTDDPREHQGFYEELELGAEEYWNDWLVDDIWNNPTLTVAKWLDTQGLQNLVQDEELILRTKNEWFKTTLHKTLHLNYGATAYKSEARTGVPQGAPTSCSLATLALRPLEETVEEREEKILMYADDVIYFPKSSSEDPKEILENQKLGIEVNESKSGWVKKDGVWVKESLKFLGFRYYPSRKMKWNTMELIILVVFCLLWDIILGLPLIVTGVGLYSEYLHVKDISREKYTADTRNGSTLEFTNKESFLAYLVKARDALLEDASLKNYWSNQSLESWLEDREMNWGRLKNKSKLLWTTPITGILTSRMLEGKWTSEIVQDFRFKYIEESWARRCLKNYQIKWEISPTEITIFTATSFACHDLMHWLTVQKLGRK